MTQLNVERAVHDRYAAAAHDSQPNLCCAVSYDPKLLEAVPPEVVERDYGCGDPSKHVRSGDTVLDLGSGTGKVCFIAAQIAGSSGRAIGVDFGGEMLEIARRARAEVARAIGYDNVEFRRGMIQDLRLDLDRLDAELKRIKLDGADGWLAARQIERDLRENHPLIPDESVDLVMSNCVLNLVAPQDKHRLFAEIYRVLRPGGRFAISDIVADEPVPEAMQNDPELWSGCISGALLESEFLDAFESVGFKGVRIADWSPEPWRVIEGIEFRSATLCGIKLDGPCVDRLQAVVYKGPFREVADDEGHVFRRGRRYAVCSRTWRLLHESAYRDQFLFIEPAPGTNGDNERPWDPNRPALRHPQETKGGRHVQEHTGTPSGTADACCAPSPARVEGAGDPNGAEAGRCC